MRILVVSPYLPHRRVGHGGGTAVRDLLRWLARRHEVTAACLVRPGEADLVEDVRALGVAVAPLAYAARGDSGLRQTVFLRERAAAALRAVASGYPLYVEKYWTPVLSATLASLVARLQPHAVQIEYLQMALHCRDFRRLPDRSRPRLVLNTHELGSLPRERRAQLATSPLARLAARREAARWRRLQVAASGWADRTLCVTDQDRDLLAAMGGVRLTTVPLGMDIEHVTPDWRPEPGACRVLFVGSFQHRPNRSGVRAFLTEAWPRIRTEIPGAHLDLAGRGSDSFLSALGDPVHWQARGVTAHGYVDDLAPLFRACHVFAAHLTEGGGIKIKVLEALARGVPVVATPVAAEGIAGGDRTPPLVAAPGVAFADAVLRVASDASLAASLAAGGRRLIEENFGWGAIVESLSGIYAGQEP
ncbi:MAG: glycosyltransferase family 4 protein [bacterium]|nr:glycosyltransferase family 4 protein [bacterium]